MLSEFLSNKFSEEILPDIDEPIRELIIELNKIESVETLGSCCGHTGERIQPYIFFRHPDYPLLNNNLKKVLKFFEELGFDVKFREEISPHGEFYVLYERYIEVRTTLYSSRDNEITKEKMIEFWRIITEKLKVLKVDGDNG